MWLLDTNVISELGKPKPNEQVKSWIAAQPSSMLLTSAVTMAEIRFGIEVNSDPLRRQVLKTWLEEVVRPMFGARIIAVSEDILFRWRLLAAAAQQNGRTMPQADALIAATAAFARLTVCTRDVLHYVEGGVSTFNPWTGERFNGA
jgi:toxin FitB